MVRSFSHRAQAGEVLARSLSRFARQPDVIVLGIPYGGVPVAFEVARALGAPLDLCLFEPITLPEHATPLGLLGWPPAQQLHEPVITALEIDEPSTRDAVAQAWRRLRQQVQALRPPALPPSVAGRRVILVDEGVSRGLVLHAAAGLLRHARAQEVIAAVPVGSREALNLIGPDFDDLVCPWQPEPFDALAPFYGDFRPVTEEEVRALLLRAWRDWGRLDTSPLGAS